ncbi:stage II sporulation protein M [Paenibacillus arenosi]|uniref:Stage II sporulation protein M n=1 Tax=Paenibacillus arenosi TaxID=2774142 RepID=A0ABR9ASW0_9BACL|nr:stage II sporulation protein M [Paenibacillus arenosi]MBD8497207.1 stage II sporulation protein M [Paenibacillus arenosi]
MKINLKQVWQEEKKRFILAGLFLVAGLFLGITLGNYVDIDPKTYYNPQYPEWYTLALNNIVAGLIIAASGLLLSVPTIMFLLFNGIMIGFISVLATSFSSVETILAGLLPHGILEIPALLIAGAIGLKPLVWAARFIKLKQRVDWKREGTRIGLLLVIMTILLIGASFIEAYVTPSIMEWTR